MLSVSKGSLRYFDKLNMTKVRFFVATLLRMTSAVFLGITRAFAPAKVVIYVPRKRAD